jgi:pimeloyl-ACP methyl ester carboxylesterase
MNEQTTTPRARRGAGFYVALALVAGLLGLGAVSCYMGGKLVAPANHPVGAAPASLAAIDITFPAKSGSPIHGWLSIGTPGRGAVLLLHGVRSDCRSMVGRAEFLHKLDYSLLLIDLQAHGESPGQQITVGHLESRDIVAARDFLRQTLPNERVAAIGVSLGAASIALTNGQASFDAVVLESMYPTISEAIEDRLRLRLGAAGTLLAPLLTMQLEPRLGIAMDQLRPIDHIASLGAPLLLTSRDRGSTHADR